MTSASEELDQLSALWSLQYFLSTSHRHRHGVAIEAIYWKRCYGYNIMNVECCNMLVYLPKILEKPGSDREVQRRGLVPYSLYKNNPILLGQTLKIQTLLHFCLGLM